MLKPSNIGIVTASIVVLLNPLDLISRDQMGKHLAGSRGLMDSIRQIFHRQKLTYFRAWVYSSDDAMLNKKVNSIQGVRPTRTNLGIRYCVIVNGAVLKEDKES